MAGGRSSGQERGRAAAGRTGDALLESGNAASRRGHHRRRHSASTDGTAEIIRQWPAGPVPVRLIRCDRPGKGAAVRVGLLATQAPYVGFRDADMATDLSAPDVAVAWLSAGDPLVIGSRAHPESVVDSRHSAIRRLGAAVSGSRHGSWCRSAGHPVRLQVLPGEQARAAAAHLTAAGFTFDIELISRCQRLTSAPAIEIPVIWREGSTFSVWRLSLAAFWGIVGIWIALRRPRRPAGGTHRCRQLARSVASAGRRCRAVRMGDGCRLAPQWRHGAVHHLPGAWSGKARESPRGGRRPDRRPADRLSARIEIIG